MQFSYIRKVALFVFFILGFGMLTGCASNFVRPEQNAITLGKSTSDQVVKATKGNPIRQNNISINNEKINVLTYQYIEGAKFYGMMFPRRSVTFSFFNDVLIGEEFNSTYDGEKTEFDTKKVTQIQKGQTQEQVIGILGKPSGKILYPIVPNKTGFGLVYAYSFARMAPFYSPSFSYLLVVSFDANNVVTSISYKENGKEQIAMSSK